MRATNYAMNPNLTFAEVQDKVFLATLSLCSSASLIDKVIALHPC